jgi:(p)ppGpp synthase/HD superfamily hydrolase
MDSKLNSWDREKYLKAWYFASVRHTGQKYGSYEEGVQIDYLTHLGKVSMEIIWAISQSNYSYDADLAVQCAILHDTIEDTSTTYEELVSLFGQNVANGVLALTKNDKLPSKAEQMDDSLERIKQQPKEIWMVKMADRISNLYQPPYYWNNEKIHKYLDEAKIIHNQLHQANEALSVRLEEKIDNYKTFINQV